MLPDSWARARARNPARGRMPRARAPTLPRNRRATRRSASTKSKRSSDQASPAHATEFACTCVRLLAASNTCKCHACGRGRRSDGMPGCWSLNRAVDPARGVRSTDLLARKTIKWSAYHCACIHRRCPHSGKASRTTCANAKASVRVSRAPHFAQPMDNSPARRNACSKLWRAARHGGSSPKVSPAACRMSMYKRNSMAYTLPGRGC